MTGTGAYTGGLVGYNTGTITNSYANAAINGGTNTGGLVGRNDGTIQGSYAAGTLLGSNRLGGLVGVNTSAISNSYSTVAVTSNFFVQDLFGGLVGQNTGSVTNSYASGVMVVNPNNAGGLIGLNQGGVISNSYWNTQTTGQATSSGGTARTTAQMQQSANFGGWDFASTWTIYAGVSSPLLNSLMTPLTVTANNQVKTYTGVAHSGGNGVTYTTLVNGIAPAGTLSFSGTSQGKTTV
ncbi:MAG: GLUG motif-containing protein, partial [Opitutaceae bacterium]